MTIESDIAKALADDGLLIEAGFEQLKTMAMPKAASERQVHECRLYFMAGAQHLFASIMQFLDEGSEPTANDLERMTMVSNELQVWKSKLEKRFSVQSKRMQ